MSVLFVNHVKTKLRDKDVSCGGGAHIVRSSGVFLAEVDELYFESEQEIKDVDQLKCLFELFSATLMRLVEIDSAFETDPMIRLN